MFRFRLRTLMIVMAVGPPKAWLKIVGARAAHRVR